MMAHCLSPTSFFLLLLLLLPARAAHPATITIRALQPLDYVDDHFICATLDWWPPDKCDYGSCSWDHASLLNLNLTHPLLRRAVKAFSPLKIRLGGSLQDKVIYDVGHPLEPCTEFSKSPSSLFGFSNGCLPMSRWDELHNFFQETESEVVFGLNALYGRIKKGTHYTGPWNSSNAQEFIQYTVDHGYKIDAWEFGNELSGSGVGTSISAVQYAADVKELRRIIEQIYKKQSYCPLVIAPDGFLDEQWFKDFLQEAGANGPDIVSHHIYNLGAGVDPNLVTKILNPSYLDKEEAHFLTLQDILSESGSKASSWVGEAGGAYNSGQHLVTDAFVSSFWYVDQLGMAARFGTKCYCRQSLIGGNYGLLNTTTFEPNPDYYSALLWHRLMGQKVLAVQVSSVSSGALSLRTYGHCSKNMDGITLVLLNFSNQTTYHVTASIQPSPVSSDAATLKSSLWSPEIFRAIKSYWRMESPQSTRLEYHLSAAGGSIHSQAVNLNGASLSITKAGDIPGLVPNVVDSSSPISLPPLTIAFVQFPGQFLACSS